MSKNLDKLKGLSDVKQDIGRRSGNGLTGKEALRLNKRINDISKVISDPDVWNVNIASRERIDRIEEKLNDLIGRINGISYIMKNLISNKRIGDEDLQTLDNRIDNDNSISGSSE